MFCSDSFVLRTPSSVVTESNSPKLCHMLGHESDMKNGSLKNSVAICWLLDQLSDMASTLAQVVDGLAAVALPIFCIHRTKACNVRKSQVGCYDDVRRFATRRLGRCKRTVRWSTVYCSNCSNLRRFSVF